MKTKIYCLDQAVWGSSNTRKYYFATQDERNQEYKKRNYVSKFEITVSEEEAEELITDTKASISLEKEEKEKNKYLK